MNIITRFILLFMTLVPSSLVFAFHTDTHFEDTVKHKIVYQLSKSDTDYIDHVLFSAGEMLRKYGDDIHIVIVAIGPGLQLLGKMPSSNIKPLHKERVSSLASYGVTIQACGNTMKSVNWEKKDLIDEAVVVPIGIDGIMKLQEQGYAYISW